jgi:hypothetical protein
MEQENETDGSKFVHQWKLLAKRTGAALYPKAEPPLNLILGTSVKTPAALFSKLNLKQSLGFPSLIHVF